MSLFLKTYSRDLNLGLARVVHEDPKGRDAHPKRGQGRNRYRSCGTRMDKGGSCFQCAGPMIAKALVLPMDYTDGALADE